MQQFDINEGNVAWVVRNLNNAMGNGQFSNAEVIVGAAQFVGNLIVSLAETPVAGLQVAQVLTQNIRDTMMAGYSAKGYNMGGE